MLDTTFIPGGVHLSGVRHSLLLVHPDHRWRTDDRLHLGQPLHAPLDPDSTNEKTWKIFG